MVRTFPTAAPVRRLRLYEEIAARVAAYILDHDVPAGGRLPAEGEIARSLGVSRPAVREAIVALETAGIVIARSGGGLFVLRRPRRGAPLPWARRGDPGPGPREQLRARLLIEPEIAAEAARVATTAHVDALDEAARSIAAAATAGLPFAEEAVEWHIALAEAAGVAPLAEFMPRLLDSAQHAMWRTIRAKSETDKQASARNGVRERLVAALRARDAEAARRVMREHLEAVAQIAFGEVEDA
ncbi:FCD domain-containing protein [Roseomonas sp. CAU 1739]|uniref:FadR/GntR family transcriptional regulator n=1 Tax=Roseomonas sp. CAU 1739 TaxID=3140364 RepID=UPI00325ADDC8